MKKNISFVLVLCFILISFSFLQAGIFQSKEEKAETEALYKMDNSQLISLILKERADHKENIDRMKKDYNKLYSEYDKYFTLYQEAQGKQKIPFALRHIKIGLSAGMSAFLNPDNLLKSNFDAIIGLNIYYKFLSFLGAYQPMNKNVLFMMGFVLPSF